MRCYRRFPGAQQQHSRATLTWKKGAGREEDEMAAESSAKKKVKRAAGGPPPVRKEEVEEAAEPTLEDIPQDKAFTCAVTLAEINRKLGFVMWKPPPPPV